MAQTVGTIESAWRYPVKSMRGEACATLYLGFAGVYGDRLFAFHNAAAPKVFPYLTGRNKAAMTLYAPRFRYPERAGAPPLIDELEKLGPGVTPLYGTADDLAVDVVTPSGALLAVNDPALAAELSEGVSKAELSLIRSERALTDCRPVSLLALQTVKALGDELDVPLDKRRFRANLYADLAGTGFSEDRFLGRRLKIGARAVIAVTERDPRCAMIGIDPVTAARNSDIPRRVVKAHAGMMGVYGVVMTEGIAHAGDEIVLLD